jgi:hypothetical protein
MQLVPVGHNSIQYLVFWYIAETLPPDLETMLETTAGDSYKPPPPYPTNLTLRDRLKMESEGYEPLHHEGTGVDEEEKTYKSHLLTLEEAMKKLGKNGVMANVVERGWKGIQDRFALEEAVDSESPLQHE